MVYGIIIAGGVGQRMHSNIPKQFMTVYDKPLIVYTLERFEMHPMVDKIIVSCLQGWEDILVAYARQYKITKLDKIVQGGKNGQESIFRALKAAHDEAGDNNDDIVLIHDAIRPNVSQDIITEAINVCRSKGNAIPVIPCQEVMLEISNPEDKISNKEINRALLKRTQTPQAARLNELFALHTKAIAENYTSSLATCSLLVAYGKELHLFNGSEKNLKITTGDDLDIFKALLQVQSNR